MIADRGHIWGQFFKKLSPENLRIIDGDGIRVWKLEVLRNLLGGRSELSALSTGWVCTSLVLCHFLFVESLATLVYPQGFCPHEWPESKGEKTSVLGARGWWDLERILLLEFPPHLILIHGQHLKPQVCSPGSNPLVLPNSHEATNTEPLLWTWGPSNTPLLFFHSSAPSWSHSYTLPNRHDSRSILVISASSMLSH